METLVDTLFNEIIIVVTLGCIGGFGAWLKKIKSVQDTSCKRLWRLEKAFSMFVKMELIQTKREHPETNTEEIEMIIEEMLTED